ncbi:MAG: HAD family phosphatase [Verrucomicrobia bacterium]|nr:HAD family phosphatase [Verrucomicrobiota bacterium]
MEHIKAVFVDLDGTLVDSMSLLYEVYLSFLRGFGISGSKEEFNSLVGPSIPEVVLLLQKQYQLPPDYTTLLQTYHSTLTQKYVEEIQLFPDVKIFLKFIKKRGLKLLLVTSAQPFVAHAVIDRLDIRQFFDAVVTSEGLERSKPDPAIYKRALGVAQVMPSEAIAIEDSTSGMEAAVGAGIYPIWFKAGSLEYQEGKELVEAGSWRAILQFFQDKVA